MKRRLAARSSMLAALAALAGCAALRAVFVAAPAARFSAAAPGDGAAWADAGVPSAGVAEGRCFLFDW